MKKLCKISIITSALAAVLLLLPNVGNTADEKGGKTVTMKGEIVDLMCYLDHGAKGEKHAGCAQKCIKGGGPVGLLSDDQVYLLVGEHQAINDEAASKAAQTVTVTGKLVERGGMKMIENAQLQ